MTDREILIAGAVAYWCEGAKSKPHRHVEQVAFINSDRALNVGEGYHGCLRIDVRRSGDLYRKIEGWAAAAMSGPVLSARPA